MFETIIIFLFLVFSGVREYFFYIERQKLLDRIQAKDLNEYKIYEATTKEEKDNKKEEEKRGYNWL
jgi:hypothetical protein